MAMLRENNNDVIVTLKESWFVLHSNMDFDLRVWNVMLIFLWKSSACLLIPNDLYWSRESFKSKTKKVTFFGQKIINRN